MNVAAFENKRWRAGDQAPVFRHTAARTLLSEGQTVLDVGCGDGLFLRLLKEKGIAGVGIDASDEAVRKCREKGLEASVVDLSSDPLPFGDSSFDAVTLLDVLEHIYAPEELLREAARVAKRSIIISVPNFNSLPARLQALFGGVPENNRPNKGHVYWFNRRVLLGLCRNAGLEPSLLVANAPWGRKPLIGPLMQLLARLLPSLLALSFVGRFEKAR